MAPHAAAGGNHDANRCAAHACHLLYSQHMLALPGNHADIAIHAGDSLKSNGPASLYGLGEQGRIAEEETNGTWRRND
jgi:hypothetical protein